MLSVMRNSWALLLGMMLLMLGNGIQGTLLGIRGVAATRREGFAEVRAPRAGSLPSAINAVLHALSYAGVTQLDMPFTSLRVWQALRQAQQLA